jgi:hypothetical protein
VCEDEEEEQVSGEEEESYIENWRPQYDWGIHLELWLKQNISSHQFPGATATRYRGIAAYRTSSQ